MILWHSMLHKYRLMPDYVTLQEVLITLQIKNNGFYFGVREVRNPMARCTESFEFPQSTSPVLLR